MRDYLRCLGSEFFFFLDFSASQNNQNKPLTVFKMQENPDLYPCDNNAGLKGNWDP